MKENILSSHVISDNNEVVKSMKEVTNGFQSFFVNLDPSLANSVNKNNDVQFKSGWTWKVKFQEE